MLDNQSKSFVGLGMRIQLLPRRGPWTRLLAPLGNSGEPTLAVPPWPDSPLIDRIFAVISALLLLDTRGLPHSQRSIVDTGISFKSKPNNGK